MKKILISFSLLISLNSYSQTKVNEIKVFKGKITHGYAFEGASGFYLNNKLNFIFKSNSLDKNILYCKMNGVDYLEIIAGLVPVGTKLKVKAKATYTIVVGLCDDCVPHKELVWKPIEIIRMAK
jgi:hypothetical protein